MKKTRSVDEYISNAKHWQDELMALVDLLRQTELAEAVKWGAPCYEFNGQNVVGVLAFKNYFGLWFHQGVLLKDKDGVLINAQPGTTKALRQWRMTDASEINSASVIAYVNEAIQLARDGKKVPVAKAKTLVMPPELAEALARDANASESFDALTPGKQREYADYISAAKQDKTKQTRLAKTLPMIESGVGLHDKYK